jgi:hypothetical protein
MGVFDRVKSLVGLGREGSWRGPFMGAGELGNMYSLGSLEDGWQRNLDVSSYGARTVPTVYACGMVIARSVGQC